MDEYSNTIVGGRYREGSTRQVHSHGIEILLKKAKADRRFRDQLLNDPLEAAASIELDLVPTEQEILRHTPQSTLRTMIDNTTIPARYVPVFRAARKAVTLAAVIASTAVTPGLAGERGQEVTMGILAEPLEMTNPGQAASEQMCVIQEALQLCYDDHGRYPTTEEWLEQDYLAEYLVWGTLFDPWYDMFHYQGMKEQGTVVDYRLESKGDNLASPHDTIPCPIDPELHSFGGPSPLSIGFPAEDQVVHAAVAEDGRTLQVEFTATHENPRVIVTWFLDGVELGTTVGDHEPKVAVTPGEHELSLRDENEHEAALTFTVAGSE